MTRGSRIEERELEAGALNYHAHDRHAAPGAA